MLIEKVTGNSYAEEVENRIIEPLDLSNTFLPGNSSVIPGTKHARGYLQLDKASELKDVTYINPGSSDGDMISTADDLNKFFSYLLGGKLLKEQQLKQMLTTVPTEREELDMVLEYLKLSFQMVSRYGDTGEPFQGFPLLLVEHLEVNIHSLSMPTV